MKLDARPAARRKAGQEEIETICPAGGAAEGRAGEILKLSARLAAREKAGQDGNQAFCPAASSGEGRAGWKSSLLPLKRHGKKPGRMKTKPFARPAPRPKVADHTKNTRRVAPAGVS